MKLLEALDGMGCVGAWRSLWYQIHPLAGLVCAQCGILDLRGWAGSSVLSSHPDGPYKPTQPQRKGVGDRESLFSLPVWLFQKLTFLRKFF